MSDFPEPTAFPDKSGLMPDSTLYTVHNCFGTLLSQDGNDLHNIHLHLALGPRPQDGFATVNLGAENARSIANHLLHLAKYAELGIEAEQPDE